MSFGTHLDPFLPVFQEKELSRSPSAFFLGDKHGSLEKARAGWVSQDVLSQCLFLPVSFLLLWLFFLKDPVFLGEERTREEGKRYIPNTI